MEYVVQMLGECEERRSQILTCIAILNEKARKTSDENIKSLISPSFVSDATLPASVDFLRRNKQTTIQVFIASPEKPAIKLNAVPNQLFWI